MRAASTPAASHRRPSAFGEQQIANFRKQEPPQTILGAEQKAWFLNRLKTSTATWKVWGNTTGDARLPRGSARTCHRA